MGETHEEPFQLSFNGRLKVDFQGSRVTIATNLAASSREVVRFYNKRGTAEQWIKEGKQAGSRDEAAFLPSLPGQRGAVVAEPDRLQPREFVAAGAADAGRRLVADQPAAAAGENRRALNKARLLLLAAPGGESCHAAVVAGMLERLVTLPVPAG